VTDKLERLLKYLVERKEGLDKPVAYQEDVEITVKPIKKTIKK
jgi:hypothetical protein